METALQTCWYCRRTGPGGFSESLFGKRCDDIDACEAAFDRYIEACYHAAAILNGASHAAARQIAANKMLAVSRDAAA